MAIIQFAGLFTQITNTLLQLTCLSEFIGVFNQPIRTRRRLVLNWCSWRAAPRLYSQGSENKVRNGRLLWSRFQFNLETLLRTTSPPYFHWVSWGYEWSSLIYPFIFICCASSWNEQRLAGHFGCAKGQCNCGYAVAGYGGENVGVDARRKRFPYKGIRIGIY